MSLVDDVKLAQLEREAERRHMAMLAKLVVDAGWIGKELRISRGDLEHPPCVIVHRHEDPKSGDVVFRFEESPACEVKELSI